MAKAKDNDQTLVPETVVVPGTGNYTKTAQRKGQEFKPVPPKETIELPGGTIRENY